MSTIEKVKEHFKNAKTVICTYGGKATAMNFDSIRYGEGCVDYDVYMNDGYYCLYDDDTKKFAEIVEYKAKTNNMVTIEKVREHFKDAKTVKCLSDNSIKDYIENEVVYYDKDSLWCIGGEVGAKLYDIKTNTFAEKVEYKTTTAQTQDQTIPDYYELEIFNRKTGESLKCDYLDIATAIKMTPAQFSTFKYSRVKGDLEKEINDSEKAEESQKAHTQFLKLKLKL